MAEQYYTIKKLYSVIPLIVKRPENLLLRVSGRFITI